MAGGRAGSAAARPDGKRVDQLCKPGEARRAIRTGGLKMRKRLLGRTGVLVSEFALGTMTFGQEADETSADALMDHYVESGGNLIDTADVVPRGPGGGNTSEGIGWSTARRARR